LGVSLCSEPRSQPQTSSPPTSIKVTIDTRQGAPAVTKYEYGQFIEHIGSTMYSSVWAEMLDDRKFYFPIASKQPESSKGQGQQSGGATFGMVTRKWHSSRTGRGSS
jgi:alpha-N-arabinofuranosidase